VLLALAGCGSSGSSGSPIPATQAERMIALLQKADSQASAGTCEGAQAKVRETQGILATLPKSVDADLRRELANGMDRLLTLIADQCQRPQPSTTTTTPTETTTTPTTTTPTDTTPTDTTPTDTTPTDTTPTDTTPTDTTPSTTTTTPTTTTGTGGTPPPPANGATGTGGHG
jgi:hypothetical protein